MIHHKINVKPGFVLRNLDGLKDVKDREAGGYFAELVSVYPDAPARAVLARLIDSRTRAE
jgi:hypothetical protein